MGKLNFQIKTKSFFKILFLATDRSHSCINNSKRKRKATKKQPFQAKKSPKLDTQFTFRARQSLRITWRNISVNLEASSMSQWRLKKVEDSWLSQRRKRLIEQLLRWVKIISLFILITINFFVSDARKDDQRHSIDCLTCKKATSDWTHQRCKLLCCLEHARYESITERKS